MLAAFKEQTIKDFIIQELLDESVIPTLQVVCDRFIDSYGQFDMSAPLHRDYTVIERDTVASASVFNETSKRINIDIETLYRFIKYIDNKINDLQYNSLVRLESLIQKLKTLNSEAESILLMLNDSDSFSDVKTIDFSNPSFIDTDNTTACVDYDGKKVCAGSDLSSTSMLLSGSIYEVTSVCSTKGCIRLETSSSPNNIKLPIGFRQTAVMSEIHDGPVELSLKIKLKEAIECNTLMLNIGASSVSAELSAYSGGRWQVMSEYKDFSNSVNIDFESIVTDSFILKIRQKYSDTKNSDGKLYLFYGKSLVVGKVTYLLGSLFQTTEISFDNDIKKMALRADCSIPEGCSVDFQIQYRSDDVWSSWENIVPVNFSGSENKTIVPEEITYNASSELVLDFSFGHQYNYGSNIPVNLPERTEPFILRPYEPIIIRASKCFKVHGNSVYSAALYCDEDLSIDVSSVPMYVDNSGELLNIRAELAKGFHTIVFTAANAAQLTAYSSALGTHCSWGAYTDKYASIENFLKSSSGYYTIIDKTTGSTTYRPLVKLIESGATTLVTPRNEKIILVDTVRSSEIITDSIKVKASISALKYATPYINSIQIKVG